MTVTPFVDWPAHLVLVLASASPRRAELLGVAGIPFEVIPAAGAESGPTQNGSRPGTDPVCYARDLAEIKARVVATSHQDRLVLGADTVVVLDDQILEKPVDDAEARRILEQLSGREHTVITAVALRHERVGVHWIGHAETRVHVRRLEQAAIARYVATGEPRDKAGAYGIQGYGALMVDRIAGCYFNVMGLPLALLGEALREVLADGRLVTPPARDGK